MGYCCTKKISPITWLIIVGVAVLLIVATIEVLFWAGIFSHKTADSFNSKIWKKLETTKSFGVDYVLIKSATVNETIIRELKRRHLNNYESIVRAAEYSNNLDKFLSERDIKKITVWKPVAGLKTTLDTSFDESVQFFKGDIVKHNAKDSEVTVFVDLKNLTIYGGGLVKSFKSSNRQTFQFFYSYKDSLLGFEATEMKSLVDFTTMLSFKKNAKFLEISGRLWAFAEKPTTSDSDIGGEKAEISKWKKQKTQGDLIMKIPTSWAKLFSSTGKVMFLDKESANIIDVEGGKNTILDTPYGIFFMDEMNSWIEINYEIIYDCMSTREKNTIEVPWLPREVLKLEMSEKTSTAIHYAGRANASYITLADDFTTERFKFEPEENLITMENSMKIDRKNTVIKIWDAENREILVQHNDLIMTCYRNYRNNEFEIARHSCTVNANDRRILLYKNFIQFSKNNSFCSIYFLLEKLGDKEFKMNKTCWGDDFSANLIVRDSQLRAIHGKTTLTLFISPNSMRLETSMGNATRKNGETVLNCGWATARVARKLFFFQIWDAVVEDENDEYNRPFQPNDFIIVNSEHVNISMSQMRANTIHTHINTIHSKITLINV